jgi:hypothetical protein
MDRKLQADAIETGFLAREFAEGLGPFPKTGGRHVPPGLRLAFP